MEDREIVALYLARSENAIRETSNKYERYCHAIATAILANEEDAKEAVNDTWLAAWNSIPPHRPELLSTFLGKLTRRISIKKWEERTAKKRGGGKAAVVLDELSDCVPAASDVEREFEEKRLAGLINAFVRALPETEQQVFVCRYWYMDSVMEICTAFGFSQSKVKSMLARTRKKLQAYLEKEGIAVYCRRREAAGTEEKERRHGKKEAAGTEEKERRRGKREFSGTEEKERRGRKKTVAMANMRENAGQKEPEKDTAEERVAL